MNQPPVPLRQPADADYTNAGVDIDAANRAVERIKRIAAETVRPEVLAGVGPFSALFQLGSYRQPVLVSSTDGVGTKVLLARVLERYNAVGVDLVNHCVNDILTSGAEPLFFLDYLAGNRLSEDAKVDLVAGMARACAANGCALVGGETADMPGLYTAGDFDIAGFIVGVVERDAIIDGRAIIPGDAILGLPANGLHTNGYSLVRHIWRINAHQEPAAARAALEQWYPELGESLADALLRPHPSYLDRLRPVLPQLLGIAHITGGGLLENVPRILPDGVMARFSGEWPRPPIFDLIQQRGQVPIAEMYRVFNMGIGAALIMRSERAAEVRRLVPDAFIAGSIQPRPIGAPAVTVG